MGRVAGRRPVAVATALVLAAEAVGIVGIHIFLGMVVDKQEMSLAGLDPHAMTVGTWIGGGFLGLYLLLCGAILVRAAVRNAPPAGIFRTLLICCAVLHAVLGAVTAGIVGWSSFAFMMVVLALLVWSLVWFAVEPARKESAEANGPEPVTP